MSDAGDSSYVNVFNRLTVTPSPLPGKFGHAKADDAIDLIVNEVNTNGIEKTYTNLLVDTTTGDSHAERCLAYLTVLSHAQRLSYLKLKNEHFNLLEDHLRVNELISQLKTNQEIMRNEIMALKKKGASTVTTPAQRKLIDPLANSAYVRVESRIPSLSAHTILGISAKTKAQYQSEINSYTIRLNALIDDVNQVLTP